MVLVVSEIDRQTRKENQAKSMIKPKPSQLNKLKN